MLTEAGESQIMTQMGEQTCLLESLVVNKAGSIFGYLELALLDLLAKFPDAG
jgi:hypothetical protein